MELINTPIMDSDEFAFDLQRFVVDDGDSDYEPTEGDDSIYNEDDDVTIDALGGNDTIDNIGSNVSINGNAGNDFISNTGSNVTLEGGADDDYIANNGGNNVVISASAGDDYIDNSGATVKIDAGEGYDLIYNKAAYVSINAGAGNDEITNSGNRVSINGGEGNDLIRVGGERDSINVGEGNDTIIVDDEDIMNLTVENFGVGDVIVLAKSVDSIEKSSNTITVGDLTIRGPGKTATEKVWVLNEKGAIYAEITTAKAVLSEDGKTIVYSNARAISAENIKETFLTIEGVTSTEGLSIDEENKIVTVSASALSQNSTVKLKGDEYKLALADDVQKLTEYPKAGWRLNGTTASYVDGSTTEGYELSEDGTQISYKSLGSGKTLAVVNGIISTEKLDIDVTNKTVTVPADSLREDLVVTVNNGYTLELGTDVSRTASRAGSWRFSDTTASYVKGTIFEGYVLENDIIFYESRTEGEIKTVVKVDGVTSRDGLKIDEANKVVTVSESSLSKDSTVTINDEYGYTLKLADDVTRPTNETVEWVLRTTDSGTKAIGNISAATGGYKLTNNEISYVEAGGNGRVTVDGVISTEGLSLDGKVVTVSLKSLKSSESEISFVTISEGYTLALGEGVLPPANNNEVWTQRDNSAVYTSSSRVGGYTLENNQIIYYPDRDTEETVTINGVSKKTVKSDGSTDYITRTGNTFTISAAALDKDDVRITKGYSLALGDDVTAPKRTPAGWERDGKTAVYKTKSMESGYELSEGKIVHRDEIKASGVVTVEGVNPNDTDGLYFDDEDGVVTVYKSALLTDGTEMTISGEYTLELGDDVDIPKAKENWTFDGNKATYQEGGYMAGHRRKEGKIVYESEIKGEIKLDLEGVSALPTIIEDADNPEKRTVQFTNDSITENISVAGNAGGFEFEILADDSYSEAKFTGSADKDSITNHGEYIVISGGAGVDKITNDGSNVSIDGGSGNDRINNTAKSVVISGGKGNDNVTLSGDTGSEGNTFIYNVGDGNDFIEGFNSRDTIRIVGDSLQAVANIKGDDVVLNIGNGSITFRKAVSKETAFDNVRDSNGKAIEGIAGNKYTANGVIKDDKILLSTTFEGKYTAAVEAVDGSQVVKGISIDGGDKGKLLTGGLGKDTLISGVNDGFELTGGKGNDVFVYKGGKGSIIDYSQKGKDGKDKISIGGGLTLESLEGYEVKGENVILNYGKGNELTLRDALNKYVTFGTKSSTIRAFKEVGVFDDRDKSVTVISGQDSSQVTFNATKTYSKLETIDGSWTNEISITGNRKANYIIAGKDSSTLNGGKGKDTLVGSDDGNDVFVYDNKSGNKLIQNYGDGDIISLGSGASISEVKVTGKDKKDLELKVGSNKITIEGGADESFTFIDDGGEKTFTANGLLVNGDSASLTSSFAGNEFNMADYENYNSVNAGLLKKAFNITGDNDANSIIGGKGNDKLFGGSGNDSLWGGKGNDILTGGDGEDKFIFRAGDGIDTILDFNNGDELIIQNKYGKDLDYKKAVSKAVFNDDTLTLSVKGGGKVILAGIDANDTIKINGKGHTISGKTLK
ncbi:MAG: hypothetical protein IKZ53_02025 [Selenomonadaceae bacterium]|nr:hypothetical protein [Selenomonadaceae bacterium]